MADHLWFVPVSSGGRAIGFREPLGINVQFGWGLIIGSGIVDLPELGFNVITALGLPNGESIVACAGEWKWHSCGTSQAVASQGRLVVGTVLAAELPFLGGGGPSWDIVDLWVKVFVNDKDRIGDVRLKLNDDSGNEAVSGNLQANLQTGGWAILSLIKSGAWSGWNKKNLRVSLVLLGTTNPANIGATQVMVEWFAFRLRDQDE